MTDEFGGDLDNVAANGLSCADADLFSRAAYGQTDCASCRIHL